MTDKRGPETTAGVGVTITTHRGRRVRIRHIRPSDAGLLIDLYHRLSPETRRLRFHTLLPDMPDDVLRPHAERLAALDPSAEAALIATIEEDGTEQAVAVARLSGDAPDSTTAEAGLVVRDDYQREGLGTALFDLLLQVALARGIRCIWGVSLADNAGMHRLIQKTGLPYTSRTSQAETTVQIPLGDAPANDSGPGERQGHAEVIGD